MHRIVHFDLKGAPPNMEYFEQVLHSIKSWGATGVLIEWEDTFPYSAHLVHLGSVSNANGDDVYSMSQVQHILTVCKNLGLEVIQLVQTIGHLEFVLKHPNHRHLREFSLSPGVICPNKGEARHLVRDMIMQVLAVQPDATYFHIGGDEVWHVGVCEDCNKRIIDKPMDGWCIYLQYVRDLVLFIKEQRPELTVLMWDDMIRTISTEVLQEYKLPELVQPVVWNYETPEAFSFPPAMWPSYRRCFPTVWAGAAFKGANGSSQIASPVRRYVSNTAAWLSEMGKVTPDISFAGVVLTGWSRYDHFATLCELLPVSMNCLANCLKILVSGLSSCAELYEDKTLPEEFWPGARMAACIESLASIRERYFRIVHGDLIMTWMNPWQLETGFMNMLQVQSIGSTCTLLVRELKYLEMSANVEIGRLYGRRTAGEWLRTFLTPLYAGLAEVQRKVSRAQTPRLHFTPSVA